MLLGQRNDQESINAIKQDLGLDKPLYIQYFNYINDLSPLSIHNYKYSNSNIYLDNKKYTHYLTVLKISNYKLILKTPYLRRSYQSQRPVAEIIANTFPQTAVLAIAAILIAIILGIPLGIISAIKKNSLLDKSILTLSVIGMSLPSFFASILIAWLFAYILSNYTHLNMTGNLYVVDDLGNGEYICFKNLILPAITLGIRPLSIIVELTRGAILDILSQNYILTTKAKGLPEKIIIFKHVLKNALNPLITAISGWFASLMAGALFVEYIFDWKGMGKTIVDALEKYDLPVIIGISITISAMFLIINLIVDILYSIIDPRVEIR